MSGRGYDRPQLLQGFLGLAADRLLLLAAVERSGFKRRLLLPGIVLTAAEVVVIVLPLLSFYQPTPEQRTVLVRAAVPVCAGFVAVWGLAIASWLAPLQRAVSLRKKGQSLLEPVSDAAYRAMLLVPNRLLVLRTALWTVSVTVLALLLYALTSFTLQSVGTVVGVAFINSVVVSLFRSAWTAQILASLKPLLFPGLEPLRYFADTYFERLIKISLVIAAVGLAAIAGFIYFFLPITFEQYLLLQTYFPLLLGLTTVIWYLMARRFRGPIDVYLEAAVYGDPRDRPGSTDPRAPAAYRAAQALGYKLAASKVAFWTVAALAASIQARYGFAVDSDSAILMFGAAVVITVGVALYEALWHRAGIRPLLAHLALRHRLSPREIRTPLSLRAKMLISFGGLVLFACGLSLFWSFIQYKDLAAGFVQKQALQKLDFVRDEVRMRAAKRGSVADTALVREVLAQAALGVMADGGSFYHLPPTGAGAHATPIRAGSNPTPRLPWPTVALLYQNDEGWLDVAPLRLTGRYSRLVVDELDLGTISILYPGYRFRGPGIERPLKELLVFFIVLFGVSAGIVWFTVSEFTTPIKALETRAEEMARGELAPPVIAATEADEVGRLTFALEDMRRALRDKLRSTEEVNLDLEREVQRRTADLARKNKELYEALEALKRAQAQLVRSEKMASIGQLVAGIAHEINNPVNAIANTVGPMEQELDQVLGEISMRKSLVGTAGETVGEIRDMMRVIQNGARRTKEIVQALHNYSRVDDERLLDVDLNRSLDESLELLRHLLKGTIEVERHYTQSPRVKAHAGQISQVFLNLLTNAAQALGPKGGTIRIETERRASPNGSAVGVGGDQVVIRIIDNGPGIPPEIIPRIFDPFFTTTEVGQGSGLGLSIVHGIVERHGGTIEVDSTVGVGTTFTVTLPVEQPPPTKLPPEAPPKVVVSAQPLTPSGSHRSS